MLAASGEVDYIHEPFNVTFSPRVMCPAVKRWYQYICQDNEHEVLPQLNNLLRRKYFAWAHPATIKTVKDLGHAAEDFARFVRSRLRRRRPLLKCPHSVFSVPWFQERLNAQIVVLAAP